MVSAEEQDKFKPVLAELKGSLKAKLLDKDFKEVAVVPVRDLLKVLSSEKGIASIVFDGIITKRVLDEAKKNNIKTVVGIKKGKVIEDKDVRAIALGV